MDVHALIAELALRRPVFRSEADLKQALASLMRDRCPQATVSVDAKPVRGQDYRVDIWATGPDGPVAVELRHKTALVSVKAGGERFNLTQHGAQDQGRYDFLSDVQELEQIGHSIPGLKAYAVLLTNDHLYWDLPGAEGTVDAGLRVHEGAILNGNLSWEPNTGAGTMNGREARIALQSVYTAAWRDYSVVDTGPNGRFRFLAFGVDQQPLDGAAEGAREMEYRRREAMWLRLSQTGEVERATPAMVRAFGMYGGAQSVWVDKEQTKAIAPSGVTVGLLHTGEKFAGDLSDDDLLFHYPATDRGPGRDASEVEATKAAGRLGLPVFIITPSSPGSDTRRVRVGHVDSWDDVGQVFHITFSPTFSAGHRTDPESDDVDREPFALTGTPAENKNRAAKVRPGQQRFRYEVLKRYGHRCVVCDLAVPDVIDGAHIWGKDADGSDDPRNGLALCATHHRAYDAGLFAVEPVTLQIMYRRGYTAERLRIGRADLSHLAKKPHTDALQARWRSWAVAG